MSSQERSSAKPTMRGTNRRTGVNNAIPVRTTQDQEVRDTQYNDDFLLMEDDPYASNPPRPPSSAIRLNKQPSTQRRSSNRDAITETQGQVRRGPTSDVPPRRTQKQNAVPAPGTVLSPPRPVRNLAPTFDPIPQKKQRRNIHWLLYVGLGMIVALVLWILATTTVSWGTNKYNDIVYGYPRTYNIDAVVGHNDSSKMPSHFTALNLHGQVIIFELPGGDPSKAIDYTGPDLLQAGSDLIPITLSFSDINHDGKVDMIIHIADRDIVFYNNGTKFVPQSPTAIN